LGDKPVPAVPDRVLALKTPVFHSTYSNPLAANPKLQKALDNAIAAGPGSTWRTPVAIVALNADGTRPMAHFKGLEVHFSASLLKVAAMYTAFELKNTANDIAAELGPKTSKADLLKDIAAHMDPQIMAKVASLPALKGVTKIHAVPRYSDVFDVLANPKVSGTFFVSFKKTFLDHLEKMIAISSNSSAAACVHASGYGYLNGTLASAGFFEPGTNTGVWLAGDYESQYPYFRIPSVNDGLVAQATTVLHLARMYTLMFDGTLVGGSSSADMLALLEKAVAVPEVFIDRPEVFPNHFTVTHTKVGLGPLKPKNGGVNVYSEGSIMTHKSGRKFVVVWQNLVDADAFDTIASVVIQTVTAFLKP
jgi:hypothetical protein